MLLVEVMVAVTLTSILLGVVISLMVALRQWDRRVRDHSVQTEQLAQLAETLRADIRQAVDVSLPVKETLIVVAPGSNPVRYELRPEGCRRSVEDPDGTSPKMDVFAIGPVEPWKLERVEGGRRPAIVLSLDKPHADRSVDGPPKLLVYASLGADLPNPATSESSPAIAPNP